MSNFRETERNMIQVYPNIYIHVDSLSSYKKNLFEFFDIWSLKY